MESHLAPEGPAVLEQGSPLQWEAQMIQLTAVGGSSLRGKEDFPEPNALALLEPRDGGVYELLLSLKKEIRESTMKLQLAGGMACSRCSSTCSVELRGREPGPISIPLTNNAQSQTKLTDLISERRQYMGIPMRT
ncbi:hypothetical protein NDU88_005820 [Pleurodeles waltl]|uniref:Uncharacterized protein n=1 Tax=Pleurodeles waltl TaxID=8319 RepID=A0AAV7MZI7_PLEWA|nr:hypothetical protein NDU88_005820 [Pleurodeles waltl]